MPDLLETNLLLRENELEQERLKALKVREVLEEAGVLVEENPATEAPQPDGSAQEWLKVAGETINDGAKSAEVVAAEAVKKVATFGEEMRGVIERNPVPSVLVAGGVALLAGFVMGRRTAP